MIKNRIIPCLDLKDGRVVKGINFVELKDAGDPVEQAKIYSDGALMRFVFLILPLQMKIEKRLLILLEKLRKNVSFL